MTQKDLLENQVFEEILRERASFYLSQKKSIDFWVTLNPEFIKDNEIKEKVKKTRFFQGNQAEDVFKLGPSLDSGFFGALVSSNKEFIKWIELRYGYFEKLEKPLAQDEKFVSNGISSTLSTKKPGFISPLYSSPRYVHPDILVSKYKGALMSFYDKTLGYVS
jgi:hypothetical protein